MSRKLLAVLFVIVCLPVTYAYLAPELYVNNVTRQCVVTSQSWYVISHGWGIDAEYHLNERKAGPNHSFNPALVTCEQKGFTLVTSEEAGFTSVDSIYEIVYTVLFAMLIGSVVAAYYLVKRHPKRKSVIIWIELSVVLILVIVGLFIFFVQHMF